MWCSLNGAGIVSEGDERNTAPPFSKEEVARIREAVFKAGAVVDCPRCGSALTIEAVKGEAHGSSWWIHCTECRHNLVVRDPTQRRVKKDDKRADWRGS